MKSNAKARLIEQAKAEGITFTKTRDYERYRNRVERAEEQERLSKRPMKGSGVIAGRLVIRGYKT